MKNKTRSTNIILLAGILLLVLVGSYIGYTWLSKSTEPSNISRVGASESPRQIRPPLRKAGKRRRILRCWMRTARK